MIRALSHWLTVQVRGIALDVLGIRSEVDFVRVNRRELEEFRALRDELAPLDVRALLETLTPRIPEDELDAISTEKVLPALAKTRRACPPPPANRTVEVFAAHVDDDEKTLAKKRPMYRPLPPIFERGEL
jgi:hypothetical protein